jgi:RND family efflux transporter MFP subunit
MKRFLLPILALAALGFSIFSIVRTKPNRELTSPPGAPPRSPYAERVAAVGLIEASTENVSVGTHLPGIVEKVFVKVGAQVKRGDPLFRLDIRHLEAQRAVRSAQVTAAQAQLTTADSQLADERDQLARAERLSRERVISQDDLVRRRFAVQTAEARLREARAALQLAEARVRETETDLARSTVTAPMDGDVLQVKVRAGEFAAAGETPQPLLVLGRAHPLHVRADIDEHEAWRVNPEAKATASVRGNADMATALRFVRFEPMVIPKRSLTGDSIERVDTRVLQAIYEVLDEKLPLFVGQQMDVFIEAPASAISDAGPRSKRLAVETGAVTKN